MKNIIRFAAFILAASVIFALCSCGKEKTYDDETTEASTVEAAPKLTKSSSPAETSEVKYYKVVEKTNAAENSDIKSENTSAGAAAAEAPVTKEAVSASRSGGMVAKGANTEIFGGNESGKQNTTKKQTAIQKPVTTKKQAATAAPYAASNRNTTAKQPSTTKPSTTKVSGQGGEQTTVKTTQSGTTRKQIANTESGYGHVIMPKVGI